MMNGDQFNRGAIRPVECVKEGWELIKNDYWLLFAVALVGGLIGGVTLYVLLGAMACGIIYTYLRKIDGNAIAFDDLWKGFQWFVPGLIVMLIIVVPMIIVYGIIYVPVLLAVVMGSNLSQDEFMALMFGAIAVDLVFILIMVCIHTLLMFSFPLIVDRNLGAFGAVTTSAKAVLGNMGGVVGLFLVNFGLMILGQLAFCVGIYFVIPLVIASNVVAYRKVFPRHGGQSFSPPYSY